MADPILSMGAWKKNGEMIRDALVPLGYLDYEALTLDCTWGKGAWWRYWRPRHLIGCDVDDTKPAPMFADGTCLPFRDRTFQRVAVDGPYKLNGTATAKVDGPYGVDKWASAPDRHLLMFLLLAEGARVLDDEGILIFKSQPQVNSGRFWNQPRMFTEAAEGLGLVQVDELIFPSFRSQPERGVCSSCSAKLMRRESGEWGRVTKSKDPEVRASMLVCPETGAGHVPLPPPAPGERSLQQHTYRNYSVLGIYRKPAGTAVPPAHAQATLFT